MHHVQSFNTRRALMLLVPAVAIALVAISGAANDATAHQFHQEPFDVKATGGDKKITVTWKFLYTEHDRFDVSCRSSGASTTEEANKNERSKDVPRLTNGQAYTCTVTAVYSSHAQDNHDNKKEESASVRATPQGPPTAPTNLKVTPDKAKLHVTWDRPSNSGGLKIDSYKITAKPGAHSIKTTERAVTIPNLNPGTEYTVTVVATNSLGDGESASKTATPAPRTKPGPPQNVTVQQGDGRLILSWDPPLDDGGHPITGYMAGADVYRGGEADENRKRTTGTSVTIDGLTNGVTYTIRVWAENRLGIDLNNPGYLSGGANPVAAPGAPTNVVASPNKIGGLDVTWNAAPVIAHHGGSRVISYTITYDDGATSRTITSGTTSATISGLTIGTPYTITVYATNAAGNGPESQAATGTPHLIKPPGRVGIQIIDPDDSQVTLGWAAPNDGGSPITGYTVSYTDGTTTKNATTTGTSITIRGLTNGQTYSINVYATNAEGNGPVSRTINATPTGAPDAPTNVAARIGDRQLYISWSAPAVDGGHPITGYLIKYSDGTKTQNATSTMAGAVITGLTNDMPYKITVQATNRNGHGSASAPITATPTAGPSAPTNVAASPGNERVDLRWVAPADNRVQVTGYEVQYRLSPDMPAIPGNLARGAVPLDGSTSAALSGLAKGDEFGASMTSIGDVNRDGIDDLAVGAPFDDNGGGNRGVLHILLMNANGTVREKVTLDSSNIPGNTILDGDAFGSSVASLGDIDEDGRIEIAVGSPKADKGGDTTNSANHDHGEIHVISINSDGTAHGSRSIDGSTDSELSILSNGDAFGAAVASMGDIDGNGAADIAVGVPLDDTRTAPHCDPLFDSCDPNQGTDSGRVYILMMNTDRTVRSLQLLDVYNIRDKISNGDGIHQYDRFGSSVAHMGDIDGDGRTEIVVGAPHTDRGDKSSTANNDQGELYVISLNADGSLYDVVSTLDGSTSSALAGLAQGDMLGTSVSVIGDVDGNGMVDVAAGATGDDTGGNDRGRVYVMLMNQNGTILRAIPLDSSNIPGSTISNADKFGASITALDLDGDSRQEIVVGSPGADRGGDASNNANHDQGEVHVISASGTAGRWQSPLYIVTGVTYTVTGLQNGISYDFQVRSVGTSIIGAASKPITAAPVAPSLNAPANVVATPGNAQVSLEWAAPSGSAGSVTGYSIQYKASPVLPLMAGSIVHSSMPLDGSTSDALARLPTDGRFGAAVASIGDLDGDGTPDLAVGTPSAGDSNSGAVYILFMNIDGTIQGTAILNRTNIPGSTISAEHGFGTSVAHLGADANGRTTIAVGAPGADASPSSIYPDRGRIHVISLNSDGTAHDSTQFDGNTNILADKLRGTEFKPGAMFGTSVAALGDIDGNGAVDILVGAPGTDTRTDPRPVDRCRFIVGCDLDQGKDTGRVYTLMMNTDGTIHSVKSIDVYNMRPKIQHGNGIYQNDRFGYSVAHLGDINGDGRTEIAAGAPFTDRGDSSSDANNDQGEVFILSLNTDGSLYDVVSTLDGSTSSALSELAQSDFFGISVAAIGDVDDNGVPDIIVGAPGDDAGGNNRGQIRILLMNSTGAIISAIPLDSSNMPGNTIENADKIGTSVAVIDINGDGRQEIAAGSPYANKGGDTSNSTNSDQGEMHIIHLSGTAGMLQKIAGIVFDTTDTVTGLINGIAYDFVVSAVYQDGTSVAAQKVTASPVSRVPGIPTNVHVTVGSGQYTLSWTDPADVGSSPITHYIIQYQVGSSQTWNTYGGSVTGSPTTVTGLAQGVKHAFRVQAANMHGPGYASDTVVGFPTVTNQADKTAPVITISAVPPIEAAGADTLVIVSLPDVQDDMDSPNSISIATNITGVWKNVTAGVSHLFPVGVNSIHWRATDTSGNSDIAVQDVTVRDTTPPAIVLNGQSVITLSVGQSYTEANAACNDLVDPVKDATASPAGDAGPVDTSASGTYMISYSCSDLAGNNAAPVLRTIVVIGLPGAPTGLATRHGDSQVWLEWMAPADDGNGEITDYTIEYRATSPGTQQGQWIRLADGTSNATTATVTGLANGQEYEFRVHATNYAGVGASSSTTTETPRLAPGAPGGLAATPLPASIRLDWNAPANNGGSAITDYVVEYRIAGGNTAWMQLADGTSSSTTATVANLANGQEYEFRVYAINSVSGGIPSNVATGTPRDVPGAPSNIMGIHGNGQVWLSWDAPANDGGDDIHDYTIQYRVTGPGQQPEWTQFADGTSNATTAIITGLENNKAYEIRVHAVNDAGSGSASDVITATPHPVPGKPSNLAVEPMDSSILLSWAAPASDGGHAIEGYAVEYRVRGESPWVTYDHMQIINSTFATIGPLQNGQEYEFRAYAINDVGRSMPSDVVVAIPTMDTVRDQTPPDIAFAVEEYAVVADADSGLASIVVRIPTASDDQSLASDIVIATNITGTWQTVTSDFEIMLQMGTYTVYWRATDTAGNANTASQKVTVADVNTGAGGNTAPPQDGDGTSVPTRPDSDRVGAAQVCR